MKIRVRASFLLYLATLALLGSAGMGLGAAAALFVHELAHLLAGRCVGERFERMELTPFGGVMTAAGESSPVKGWRGALVAAAGPLGNYAAILALSAPALQALLGHELARQIMLANAVMMAFNLLPALPLDGGRIAFSLGCYALGVSRTIRVLSDLGVALGAAMLAMSGFGMARWGVLNLSALIVGGYLIVLALKVRTAMLAQNLYAVIHERCARASRVRRMQLFEAPADAPLLALLEPMERCDAAGFIVRSEGAARFVGEETVCLALLSDPTAQIGRVSEKNGEKLSV